MTNNRSNAMLLLKFKQIMAKYIDKSALVAEIKRRMNENRGKQMLPQYFGMVEEDLNILSFIDTLEMKEVDLDFQRFAKEMETIFALPSSKTENTEEEPLNWEYAIAKHFFELGLKAKDWKKVRMEECLFRKVGCTMYKDKILECKGTCSWVVDYLKLKELKVQKEE